MNPDSFNDMIDEVRRFHRKHRFHEEKGEDMVYRTALMAEELGEISACVTKGKSTEELAEECADLLILLLGNAVAADFDLNEAFWQKMQKVNLRTGKIIDGRIRVSDFAQVGDNGDEDTPQTVD